MKEIKTNRINGFLDLNSYFRKILKDKKEHYDFEYLYGKGIIDIEPSGISDKFWVLDRETGERIALFKEQRNYSYEAYSELFAEEIAKVLGIKNAHYDLAMFNTTPGVISYNFLKENESCYSGFDVISDFYDKTLEDNPELLELYNIDLTSDTIDDVVDKLNNLEDIWAILEDKYKNSHFKQQIVYRIMDKLVNKLMFDILTVNIDDHSDNWALVGSNLSPSFDNSRILNLHRNVFDEKIIEEGFINKELLLTVDNSKTKPLEVLEQFIKVSTSEYKDRFIEKVNILEQNIEYIPGIISKRTGYQIPNEISSYFIHHMYDHLDKVNSVLHKDDKVSKK